MNLEYEEVKAKGITEEWFATKEKIEQFQVDPGDEGFMVGKFVSHEGKDQNLPAARFGNLSMLPYEPVRTGRGLLQEVLVECRSPQVIAVRLSSFIRCHLARFPGRCHQQCSLESTWVT